MPQSGAMNIHDPRQIKKPGLAAACSWWGLLSFLFSRRKKKILFMKAGYEFCILAAFIKYKCW